MPEYHLDRDGEVKGLEFADLDSFTQGFIECGFWQCEAPGVGSDEWPEDTSELSEGSIPCDVGFADLEPDSLQSIADLCAEFQRDNAELLDQAYERDYSPERAGHDFWLTHVGAGVGFWDRKELESTDPRYSMGRIGSDTWDGKLRAELKAESLGDKLSKAAGRGEFYLEFNPDGEGGGTVYFSGY
jgi:hypothetical protein